MDSARDPIPWKLAKVSQRLARQARGLVATGASVDSDKIQAADRLVEQALAILAQFAVPEAPYASGSAPGDEGSLGSLHAHRAVEDNAGGISAIAERKPQRRAEDSDVPPSPEHVLALRGYEPLAPTPDLIGFLSSQRKTGVLEIVTPHEVFVLEMEEGDIAHARSDSTPPGQRLGDILVAYGMIGRDSIDEALGRFPQSRLGEALLHAGMVDNDQLLHAVRIQIQQLFNRLFEARVTRFTYWNGPPLHTDQRVRLNVISLLLEGARVTDEAKKNSWFWKMG